MLITLHSFVALFLTALLACSNSAWAQFAAPLDSAKGNNNFRGVNSGRKPGAPSNSHDRVYSGIEATGVRNGSNDKTPTEYNAQHHQNHDTIPQEAIYSHERDTFLTSILDGVPFGFGTNWQGKVNILSVSSRNPYTAGDRSTLYGGPYTITGNDQ